MINLLSRVRRERGRRTLPANRAEPPLGLLLASPARRRGRRRRSRDWYHSGLGTTLSTSISLRSIEVGAVLPPRDFAASAKLNHPDRAFLADDEMPAGEEDDVPGGDKADNTLVRSGGVGIVLGLGRVGRRCRSGRGRSGSRSRGETEDLAEMEDVGADLRGRGQC